MHSLGDSASKIYNGKIIVVIKYFKCMKHKGNSPIFYELCSIKSHTLRAVLLIMKLFMS